MMPLSTVKIESGLTLTDPEGDFPSRAAGNRAVFVLGIAMIFTQMDAVLFSLMVEPIRLDLHLTDQQIGLIQGLGFGLGHAIAAIPVGLLIDRRPRLQLLRLGLLTFIGAMVAIALARGFFALFAAEIAIGAVISVMGPAATSLVSDYFPPSRRGKGAGMLATSQLTGQAGAYLVGGLMLDLLARQANNIFGGQPPSPWRMTYILFAALSLLALPGLSVLREPKRLERTHVGTSIGKSLRELLAFRQLLIPFLAASALGFVAASAIQSWIAAIMMRTYGLPAGEVGRWLGISTLIGGVLASLLAGDLAKRARRARRPILSSAMIACLIFTPLAFVGIAPSPPWVAVAMFGIVVTSIVTQVTSSIAIITCIPNDLRGLCMGIYALLGIAFGRGLAPTLAVFAGEAFSGKYALGMGVGLVAAPCSLVAALLYLYAGRREERFAPTIAR